MNRNKQISVIIAVYNEAENIPTLLTQLNRVREKLGKSTEIIFVDDGSRDGSFTILKDLKDDRLFTIKINSKINIIAGIFDKVVPTDWILNFAKAQEATIKFLKDDHRFSKNLEKLPDIISEIIRSKKNINH